MSALLVACVRFSQGGYMASNVLTERLNLLAPTQCRLGIGGHSRAGTFSGEEVPYMMEFHQWRSGWTGAVGI
eukprot:6181552-Pleurochrysis_carterae.AAC.1